MYKTLVEFLAVAGGGALGAMARFAVGRMFSLATLPVGTFVINITGSLFLGWFMTIAGERFPEPLRLAVATGFVGAYTTFSTYMYETDHMVSQDQWTAATIYLLGSMAVGLVAVRAGVLLGRAMHG